MSAPLVPWPRAAAAVAIGCAVGFVGIGLVVAGDDHGLALDNAFNRWVLAHFDVYARYDMVQLTDPPVIVAAVAVITVGALLVRRLDLAALAVLAPLVATGLTEWVFKPLFDRTVPSVTQRTGTESEAYPSGHETAVSTVLVVLALILLRARVPLAVKVAGLIVLAGYYAITVVALVGQYFHYLTDTIGALGVAIALVLAVALALDRLAARLS